MKPPKYTSSQHINYTYVDYLEKKLLKIRSAVNLAEKLCSDQSNGMTDGSICISAMKDIRRHLKE